jgi:hypothetical protein
MTVRVLSLLTHAANMVVFEIKTYFVVMVGCVQLKKLYFRIWQNCLSYRQMKKNAKRE